MKANINGLFCHCCQVRSLLTQYCDITQKHCIVNCFCMRKSAQSWYLSMMIICEYWSPISFYSLCCIKIWVRSWGFGCLVTWFCYQVITKPVNTTAVPSWPDPYTIYSWDHCNIFTFGWYTHKIYLWVAGKDWLVNGVAFISRKFYWYSTFVIQCSGIILCMRPANERPCYNVTWSVIGWAHTQYDPWVLYSITCYISF